MNSDLGVPVRGAGEQDYALSLGDILRVIRRRLLVVALLVLMLVGAVVGLSLAQTPIYEASIKIVVGQELTPGMPSSVSADVQGLQQFTRTAAEVVQTQPVAEGVIREPNLSMTPEEFLGNMNVEQISETQLIQITYRDPDPQRAKQIADTVGEVFSRQISELSPSANSVTATLWERATVPRAPVGPNILFNVLLTLMLGGILGLGLAFLLEFFDDSWRSPEEVEKMSGLPIFGAIPEYQMPKGSSRKGGSK